MSTGPDLRWSSGDVLAEDAALELGIEAYIYGYPLVLADITRRVMTSGAGSGVRARAPVNRFAHLRAFPDHTFTDVVSPDTDMLTSTAWLSLGREPVMLSLPSIVGRYFVVTVMDAWTNIVASLGTRTLGSSGGLFAIIGPRWHGTLPSGVSVIESPTNLAWLAARFETQGPGDYVAVHAIQDQCALTPLRWWGQPSGAPLPAPNQLGLDTLAPPQQVARMDARTFFSRLNHLMRDNAPPGADAAALSRFAAIGLGAGERFELDALDPPTVESLERSTKGGQAVLVAESRQPARERVNGWDVLPPHTGAFGADYTGRAVVALIAFGASVAADCVHASASVDATNLPLTGDHRYAIRFPAGGLPPVNAGWSLSLYNAKHAFVPDALDRHAIGNHHPLKVAADGSIRIVVQREPPAAGSERNWLPASGGLFTLRARLHWPQAPILDGRWRLPAVERLV